MGDIFLSALHDSCTTDESGVATIRTKIPGTFSGASGFTEPPADGRYFKKCHFWTEDGAPGDIINNIRLEDADGIIQAMAPLYPNYPVLQRLDDEQAKPPASGGIGIPVDQIIEVEAIDPHDNRGFMFLPAQMYLCADFHAGDGASGKVLRVNYIWGRYFASPQGLQNKGASGG